MKKKKRTTAELILTHWKSKLSFPNVEDLAITFGTYEPLGLGHCKYMFGDGSGMEFNKADQSVTLL